MPPKNGDLPASKPTASFVPAGNSSWTSTGKAAAGKVETAHYTSHSGNDNTTGAKANKAMEDAQEHCSPIYHEYLVDKELVTMTDASIAGLSAKLDIRQVELYKFQQHLIKARLAIIKQCQTLRVDPEDLIERVERVYHRMEDMDKMDQMMRDIGGPPDSNSFSHLTPAWQTFDFETRFQNLETHFQQFYGLELHLTDVERKLGFGRGFLKVMRPTDSATIPTSLTERMTQIEVRLATIRENLEARMAALLVRNGRGTFEDFLACGLADSSIFLFMEYTMWSRIPKPCLKVPK